MTAQAGNRHRFAYYGADAIRAAVGFEDVIAPVAAALADFSRGLGDSPAAVFAPAGRDGDVHVKSAWLPGRPIFTVKVATWFAARADRGDSASSGLVAVFDTHTGDLRALLEDEHHLSDIRTAAAGALAARILARPNSTVLGVLGTGVQAYLQVLAAADELPIRVVRAWGRDPNRAGRFLRAVHARRPDLRVTVSDTLRQVCEGADLLVTATSSTEPLVDATWLTPGLHITAVGADDSTKVELEPACIARADRVVVDSRPLAELHGDLAHAAAVGIRPRHTPAELGELIATAVGRTSDEEITICKLIGLGMQDLAAAEITIRRLETATNSAHRPASANDLKVPST